MTEYTLSGLRANLYGLLYAIPVLLLAGIPYILIWSDAELGWTERLLSAVYRNKTIIQQSIDVKWWLLLLLAAGIVLHELIDRKSVV